MKFNPFEKYLVPSEGEVIVRSYHCTKLSPVMEMFGLRVNGHMVLTNRRLVYFAEGSSGFGAAGENQLYTEVPLADVTNITMSQGTRFSLPRLVIGIGLGMVVISVVATIMSTIWRQLGDANPYVFRALIFFQITAAFCLVFKSLWIHKESIARILLSACSLGLVLWGTNIKNVGDLSFNFSQIFQESSSDPTAVPSLYTNGLWVLCLAVGGYFFWCVYWFVKRQYFEMAITSRTNQKPAITISGFSIFGKQIVNVSASMASGLSPSIDAQALFKELGAAVSDIQVLGDLGIAKWSKIEHSTDPEFLGQSEATQDSRKWASIWLGIGIAAVAIIIGTESILYADTSAKRNAAKETLDRLNQVKNTISGEAPRLVPNTLSKADDLFKQGQNMYDTQRFVDAKDLWDGAIANYSAIPPKITAMAHAEDLQRQFNNEISDACYANSISDFNTKVDRYSELEWSQIKAATNNAEMDWEGEQGDACSAEWDKVSELLPSALKKLKVGVWLEAAEQNYQNKNWEQVIVYSEKILKESPENLRASQLRDKANESMQSGLTQ